MISYRVYLTYLVLKINLNIVFLINSLSSMKELT